MTPYDFTQSYGLPVRDTDRVRCTHAACPVCGHDLDFWQTDTIGRTLETCWTCKTQQLLAIRRDAPPPTAKIPGR